MSVLKSLKMSDTVRLSGEQSTIEKKREKLILNIERQIANAEAEDKGELYTYEADRHVLNPETGVRARQRVSVRVRPWYWRDMSGKWFTNIKYGNKNLMVHAGKKTVIVGERKTLVPTFRKIIQAVAAGEMDELIAKAAVFGKRG